MRGLIGTTTRARGAVCTAVLCMAAVIFAVVCGAFVAATPAAADEDESWLEIDTCGKSSCNLLPGESVDLESYFLLKVGEDSIYVCKEDPQGYSVEWAFETSGVSGNKVHLTDEDGFTTMLSVDGYDISQDGTVAVTATARNAQDEVVLTQTLTLYVTSEYYELNYETGYSDLNQEFALPGQSSYLAFSAMRHYWADSSVHEESVQLDEGDYTWSCVATRGEDAVTIEENTLATSSQAFVYNLTINRNEIFKVKGSLKDNTTQESIECEYFHARAEADLYIADGRQDYNIYSTAQRTVYYGTNALYLDDDDNICCRYDMDEVHVLWVCVKCTDTENDITTVEQPLSDCVTVYEGEPRITYTIPESFMQSAQDEGWPHVLCRCLLVSANVHVGEDPLVLALSDFVQYHFCEPSYCFDSTWNAVLGDGYWIERNKTGYVQDDVYPDGDNVSYIVKEVSWADGKRLVRINEDENGWDLKAINKGSCKLSIKFSIDDGQHLDPDDPSQLAVYEQVMDVNIDSSMYYADFTSATYVKVGEDAIGGYAEDAVPGSTIVLTPNVQLRRYQNSDLTFPGALSGSLKVVWEYCGQDEYAKYFTFTQDSNGMLVIEVAKESYDKIKDGGEIKLPMSMKVYDAAGNLVAEGYREMFVRQGIRLCTTENLSWESGASQRFDVRVYNIYIDGNGAIATDDISSNYEMHYYLRDWNVDYSVIAYDEENDNQVIFNEDGTVKYADQVYDVSYPYSANVSVWAKSVAEGYDDAWGDFSVSICQEHNYVYVSAYDDEHDSYRCEHCGDVIIGKKHTCTCSGEVKITKATLKHDGVVTGVCDICGEAMVLEQISRIDTVTLSKTSYTYTGSACKPTVTVKDADGNVISSEYYTVTYKNNIKVGTATVTITFKELYFGTVSRTFAIKAIDLSTATVTLSKTSYTYTGSACKPVATVKLGTKTLKLGTDYKVTYANNIAAGKATVTITGIGVYAGTVFKTFTIKPAKAAAVTLASKKTKTITVTWKAAAAAQCTGYQIRYSTTAKMTSAKTVKVTSYKTTTKTLSSLKAGTKYYVQIRYYKTVDGVTYYGDWSTSKAVTTK